MSCRLRSFSIKVWAAALGLTMMPAPAAADSTSPRLAAYYDLRMAVCGGRAYLWRGRTAPKPVAHDVVQVGVGRDVGYALSRDGVLMAVGEGADAPTRLTANVTWFAAGRSGLFAGRADGSTIHLARSDSWFGAGAVAPPTPIAGTITTASIGDSADYLVAADGTLSVQGLAHRGQYGDGKLSATDTFVAVHERVTAVKAHTGHAIALTDEGTVIGTGGNIFGPLGAHGIGDKAITWGPIFTRAIAIATGSSHSLALRADGRLWHWGRDIGLEPAAILDDVTAAAADSSGSIALRRDGTLWQWDRGGAPAKHFDCP